MTSTNILTDLDKPKPFPGANKHLLTGSPLHPQKRLAIFSPDEFEIFVSEWAFYSLEKNIIKCKEEEVQETKGAMLLPGSTNTIPTFDDGIAINVSTMSNL